jgi:hypothetical protein
MDVIKVYAETSQFYMPSKIAFTLVSSPKDGSKQIRQLSPCRDYINDMVIQCYHSDSKYYKNAHRYSKEWGEIPVDMKNLRLLIHKGPRDVNTEFQKKLKMAIKVLNLYENFAKWKERSYLNKVKFVNNKSEDCWMLIGPEEWMKSTHLISMVTLITRVVVYNPVFGKCRSVKSIERCFALLCSKTSEEMWTDLGEYLPKAWPKFRMIMKSYDEIFGKYSFGDCNPEKKCFEWHDKGGITRLCTFGTGVPELDSRMKELWKKKYARLSGSL